MKKIVIGMIIIKKMKNDILNNRHGIKYSMIFKSLFIQNQYSYYLGMGPYDFFSFPGSAWERMPGGSAAYTNA